MTPLLPKRRVTSFSSALVAGLLVASCSPADGTSASVSPGPPTSSTASGRYSIKAFVETPRGKTLVEFGPADGAPAPASNASSTAHAAATPVPGTDGGIAQARSALTLQGSSATPLTIDDLATPGEQPAWSLQYFLAGQCALDTDYKSHRPQLGPSTQPWSLSTSFHIFLEPQIQSCDDALAVQEVLLCTADKLASIADAVTPVTVEVDGSRFVVPPQAERDKFIVRDMAINALAHLAFAEFGVTQDPAKGHLNRCDDLYATGLTSGHLDVEQRAQAFGTSATDAPLDYFPPALDPVDGDPLRQILSARLAYKTHVLRAGGRLLRDLLDKSVRADMAGAEQQRASAGGTRQGARLMWGVLPDSQGFAPYNSLRHAARTLFGRLELGPIFEDEGLSPPGWSPGNAPDHDPECNGFRSLIQPTVFQRNPNVQDLVDAIGPGFAARWDDEPTTTDGEALATSLVTNLGLLVPPYLRTGGANQSTLLFAVALREGQKAGLVDDNMQLKPSVTAQQFSDFGTTPPASTAIDVAKKISVTDLAFGLDRAWDSFRLLTDSGADAGQGQPGAVSGIAAASGLAAIPGNDFFLKGRILRADLFRDAFASMIPAVAASQCLNPITNPTSIASQSTSTFTNVFSLADTFRRSIANIRDRAVAALGSSDELSVLANLGDAELRAWGAQGRVYFTSVSDLATFEADITGITPDWFDVDPSRLSTLSSRLKLVFGRPLEAECVAGLRSSCPDPSTLKIANLVTTGGFPAFLHPSDDPVTMAGEDGLELKARFHFDNFPPSDFGDRQFYDKLYFLVLTSDPNGTRQEGRVLAAFNSFLSTTAVVSDYQRSLANEAFGVGEPQRKEEQCVGDDTTTSSRSYCIDGVDRNQFVPLANELTASTGANATTEDSWKHYLTLAQQAATQADELGRQLVDLGLQQDLRREAAQEELGQLCGNFAAPDSITFTDGQPTSNDNAVANACFNEPVYDVVFLGVSPVDLTRLQDGHTISGTDVQTVQKFFCGTRTNGFCDPTKTSLTIAQLGLGSGRTPPAPTNCANIISIAGGGPLDGLAAETLKPYATPEQLQTALFNLSFVKSIETNWGLTLRDNFALAYIPGLTPGDPRLEDPNFYTPPLAPTKTYPLCQSLAPTNTAPCASDSDCGVNGFCNANRLCSRCEGSAQDFERMLGAIPGKASLRLQRAIYYMGALSGSLPAGRITLPMLAVNFNGASTANGTARADAFGPAIYGSSKFNRDGTNWILTDAPDRDIAYFRGAVAVPSSYTQDILLNAEGELPTWYHDLLSDAQDAASNPGAYVAINASNGPLLFYPNRFTGSTSTFMQAIVGQNDSNARPTTFDDIDAHGVCEIPGPNGDPTHAIPVFWEPTSKTYFVMDSFGKTTDFNTGQPGGLTTPSLPTSDANFTKLMDPVVLGTVVFGANSITGVDPGVQVFPSANLESCAEGPGSGVVGRVTAACAGTNDHQPFLLAPATPGASAEGDGFRYTRQLTLPERCAPGDRVSMFAFHGFQAGVVPSTDEMKRILADVLALSCMANGGATGAQIPTPPARAETVGDLAQLGQWTDQVGLAADLAVNAIFLENVPRTVVDAYAQGRVADVGITNEGDHGQKLLSLRQHLEEIHSGWVNAAAGIRQLGNAIDGATASLELAGLQRDARLLDVSSSEASLDKDLAMASLGVMSNAIGSIAGVGEGIFGGAATGASIGGPIGLAGGAAIGGLLSLIGAANNVDTAIQAEAISEEFADRERSILQAQAGNAVAQAETQQQKTFIDLSTETVDLHKQIENALSQIREASASALSDIAGLRANQNQAVFQMAKASGADFFQVKGQPPIALPVNTVLRRQYDMTQRRYTEALQRAKRLAYMARLSMEQRIGVRLSALNEPVGPLPAPSLWADDVCSLQGVDYKALRQAALGGTTINAADGGITVTGNSADADIGQFTDEFIGDYVEKLNEFMEFYNIEFPFHEADDRAVISLKEHLLSKTKGCTAESKNLLFFSDALYRSAGSSDAPARGGWEVHGCDTGGAACLEVRPAPAATNPGPATSGAGGAASSTAAPIVPPGGIGGVSWLQTVDPTSSGVTPGSPSGTPSPPDSVYQAANLDSQGNYVLSWWDMTLTPTGTPATSGSFDYHAAVYDSNWQLVAVQETTSTTSGGAFGPRQTLGFVAPASGAYYVTFSIPNAATGANIAIANVQLQLATPADGLASGYESTSDKRVVFTTDCGTQPGAIQNAFQYGCENGTCFWDLKAPFTIDTTEIEARSSNLTGLVGAGNYNHRHLNMAVNLVGTGVLDCTKHPTPACYGTAYVEYDLFHDAFDVPMVDYGGQPRCFTFETGAIRGGKALTAERYITFPVSDADQGLINQDGILRPEFAGRPLSGSYRLRIYDNPALNWEHLEDIQLVLGYRVWSRVTRTPGN